MSDDKKEFVPEAGASIVWPGNSSVLPSDRDLTGIAPKVVSIAWLETASSRYDFPRIEQYVRWSLARLNADKFLLPFTRIELRHEVLDGSAGFVEHCERVRREAEEEGKPVVGFISSGTSRTKDVLKMASPLPTVSYSSTQAIMENATMYPWLVRMYPSDSQVRVHTVFYVVLTKCLKC